MSNRTYYYVKYGFVASVNIRSAQGGILGIWDSLFSKPTPVPLFVYEEQGRYFEFFSGKEMECSPDFYWNDTIKEYIGHLYLHFKGSSVKFEVYGDNPFGEINNQSTLSRDYVVYSHAQFADLIKPFMPYKDEIKTIIERKIMMAPSAPTNEEKERQKQRESQEKEYAERLAEDWLNSVIDKDK